MTVEIIIITLFKMRIINVHYLVHYHFIIILSKANTNLFSLSENTHMQAYVCGYKQDIFMYSSRHTCTRTAEQSSCSHWVIEKKITLRAVRDFPFFFMCWVVRQTQAQGGIGPFADDDSMCAASLHERGATLFTDTHFVTWHCQAIFLLHPPTLSLYAPR